MQEVTANLDAAFEMANKWRDATGQNILSAWLPAVKQNANECLLARAFNSHCGVGYESAPTDSEYYTDGDLVGPAYVRAHCGESRLVSGSGSIQFEDESLTEQFADVTGWELMSDGDYSAPWVRLPDEVTLIAWQFDHGDFAEFAVERDAELTY